MRVSNMRSGHAHHVKFAFCNGMTRSGNVSNTRCMKHWKFRQRPHFAGKIQMRIGLHANDGNNFRKWRVMVNVAANNIQKINIASCNHATTNFQTVLLTQTLIPIFIRHQPCADDKLRPNRLANGGENQIGKAQAIVQRPAKFIAAFIGGRRPKLVKQMPVTLKLNTIHTSGLHALRC